MKLCSEPNCNWIHYAKGFCHMHYERVRKYGDPKFRLKNAKGEGGIDGSGYRGFYKGNKRFRDAHVVVETILGKSLPKTAIVHHANENKLDNRPSNLVVCENKSYHMFLHQRIKARAACGNVHWRCCSFCHAYDELSALERRGTSLAHRKCWNEYISAYKRRRKLKRMSLQVQT